MTSRVAAHRTISRPPRRKASSVSDLSGLPAPQGLYDPANEHDACGVAFVVDIAGRVTHDLVEQGLTALRNLEHRGASGSEPDSGDGAGILVQVPDAFYRAVVPVELPAKGLYAVGTAFLPTNPRAAVDAQLAIERIAAEEGLRVITWRDLPVDPKGAGVGRTAASVMPVFRQLFLAAADPELSPYALERRAYVTRKRAEHETGTYFPSLSTRTVVYKGMLTTGQLQPFFPDLLDERFASALALVHTPLLDQHLPELAARAPLPLHRAQRRDQHREGQPQLDAGPRGRCCAGRTSCPTTCPGCSRSAAPARPTPRRSTRCSSCCTWPAVAAARRADDGPGGVGERRSTWTRRRRPSIEFHASLMEPWDGPACVTFTDGTLIGAVLDRNGLRPSRWWETADGRVVLASEVGVLDIPADQVVRKGRLQPGKMFLVDTAGGRIVDDEEIKAELAAEHPYADWLHAGILHLEDLPEREHVIYTHESILRRQQTFGYTEEELRILLQPMAKTGTEPIGSMGTDTPVAVLTRAAPAAVRLLQPAVRAGHQPAARRDPRGARHLAVGLDRPGAEPARAVGGVLPPDRAAVPGHRQRRAREDRARQRRRRPARARRGDHLRAVPRQRRGRGAARRPRPGPARGLHGHRRWRPHHRAVRPRLDRDDGADPVAAADPRCTTTSSARRPAPGSGCSSRPETSARCTTSRCSSATAPRPSTPTSRWRPSRTWSVTAPSRASPTRTPRSRSSRRSARASSR